MLYHSPEVYHPETEPSSKRRKTRKLSKHTTYENVRGNNI
jgi:hypothetical protein